MKPLLLAAVLALGAPLVFPQTPPGDAILARAGSKYITEDEFVRRFELLPGLSRQKGPRIEEEKLVVLYSIIAEKLLAQEAADRGIDSDSLFLASMADMEKLLARDQLYRQEVAGKVRVTDAEVEDGIRRARRELFVTYLFSDSAREASFIRSRIRSAADFRRLQLDTSMGMIRDTATVIWGDADPAIENAAYRLRVGETSPVAKAETGYYILHLTRETPNTYYASMKPDVLRERVAQRLKMRKEQARLNEYIAGILKGKTGYARPVPFRTLAGVLEDVYRRHTDRSSITLTDSVLSEVLARCSGSLADTLIVAGDVAWSIGRVLERLATNGFAIEPAEVNQVPVRLNRQMEIWVWQELLGQEAIRRGMDAHPQVKRDIAEWRESFLAQFMRHYLARAVKVTDGEVLAYMRHRKDSVHVPLVQIRELRTASAVDMQGAMMDLEDGVPFEEVIRRWSNDPAAQQRNGLSEFFPITGRPPVGEAAATMNVGDFYGPVPVEGGILYFQLAARKESAALRDTSLADDRRTAREELRGLKTRRMLNLLVSQSARGKGYAIYQDRLRSVAVSHLPMMTFRVIGFGGRIFAAPMLEKQIEWIDIELPASEVVP